MRRRLRGREVTSRHRPDNQRTLSLGRSARAVQGRYANFTRERVRGLLTIIPTRETVPTSGMAPPGNTDFLAQSVRQASQLGDHSPAKREPAMMKTEHVTLLAIDRPHQINWRFWKGQKRPAIIFQTPALRHGKISEIRAS